MRVRRGQSDHPKHWDHELLDPAREASLIVLAQAGDMAARDELVLGKQRLILEYARRYADNHVPIEDLVSVANQRLLLAVNSFDRTRTNEFNTYAVHCIHGGIRREIERTKHLIRIPSYLWALARDYKAKARELGVDQASPEFFEVICGAMNLVKSRRLRLARMFAHLQSEFRGLDASDSGNSFVDPRSHVEAIERRDQIARLFRALRPSQARLIRQRFGLGVTPMTLPEIGRQVGLSKQRIKQMEDEAMAVLRLAASRESA